MQSRSNPYRKHAIEKYQAWVISEAEYLFKQVDWTNNKTIPDRIAQDIDDLFYQYKSELLTSYWSIGRIICEYEQSTPDRADYGKQTLKELSHVLT